MEFPVVVVAAIIQRDDTFLIAKRGVQGRFAGLWEFPCGKAESGEDLHTCLKREIKKEFGVDVAVDDEFSMIRYGYDAQGIVHLHSFFCRLVAGKPKPLAHAEVRWVNVGDLTKYKFVPTDISIVRQLEFKFGGTVPVHFGGTKDQHLAAARMVIETLRKSFRARGIPDDEAKLVCPRCKESIGAAADDALPEKMVHHELARCSIKHPRN